MRKNKKRNFSSERNQGNLQKTIMLTYAGVLLALLVAIMLLVNFVMQRSIADVLVEKAVEQDRVAAKTISEIYTNGGKNTTKKLQEYVEDAVESSDGKVAYCVVIDENSKAVAHSDKEKLGKEYKDDYTLSAVKKGEVKTSKFYADVQECWTYDVMVPIMVNGKQKGSLDMGIPISGIKAVTFDVIRTFLIISIIGFIVALAISKMVVKKAFKPVGEMAKIVNEIANGNLETELHYKSDDEIGALAEAIRKLNKHLQKNTEYIREMARVLEQMGTGDFDIELTLPYDGSFEILKTSLNDISNNLTVALQEILESMEQVNSGASQVADGAQLLSAGAVKQAASTEELSSKMDQISGMVAQNAKKTKEANMLSIDSEKRIEESNEKMVRMAVAMNDITEKSQEIEKIIAAIDEIAFQTNILALNAAIEAARAGEAGKGFAVVADEVGNLAGKSAESAKNIGALIQETIEAVSRGNGYTEETREAVAAVKKQSEDMANLISEIADASKKQEERAVEVMSGLGEISEVVQTNSATAEESAAASEELSGQTESVKTVLEKFKLKES